MQLAGIKIEVYSVGELYKISSGFSLFFILFRCLAFCRRLGDWGLNYYLFYE
jgi:hypothetical protein